MKKAKLNLIVLSLLLFSCNKPSTSNSNTPNNDPISTPTSDISISDPSTSPSTSDSTPEPTIEYYDDEERVIRNDYYSIT